ncbi:sulfite exporter TauE/SafE family protein [Haloferula sp. A504]|uniref:sulfite exporter TauE/SafE family protein n=1 Tax=Haloferula sp. A504 TaxID=3373601 RepID=UPI0031C654C2|nr:sulfite exporter TauE/SafE family protein [Verrucomicrobiaceae bacterium E54]
MPTPTEWLVLVAGFLAGAMNSIAGGGTMLTFPALMGVGLPPVLANTTSTVALWFGMPGSVWAFRRRLREVRRWILPLGIISLLGGLGGALLLVRLPDSVFEAAVPWLILGATALFLANEPIRRWAFAHAPDHDPEKPPRWGLLFQSGVAVYGGYFGAGIGIMMLAGLGLLGIRDLNRMNALKNLLALLCNTAAMGFFLVSGSFDLRLAVILLVGSVPGYFLGAHFAQRVPAKIVRFIVAAIGIGIAVSLLAKQ